MRQQERVAGHDKKHCWKILDYYCTVCCCSCSAGSWIQIQFLPVLVICQFLGFLHNTFVKIYIFCFKILVTEVLLGFNHFIFSSLVCVDQWLWKSVIQDFFSFSSTIEKFKVVFQQFSRCWQMELFLTKHFTIMFKKEKKMKRKERRNSTQIVTDLYQFWTVLRCIVTSLVVGQTEWTFTGQCTADRALTAASSVAVTLVIHVFFDLFNRTV